MALSASLPQEVILDEVPSRKVSRRAAAPQASSDAQGAPLQLPEARCLTTDQAAAYLGIGATLLGELGVPCVKLGRRNVYDRVDLDLWLDEHKRRGRARKEFSWPVKTASIGRRTLNAGVPDEPLVLDLY